VALLWKRWKTVALRIGNFQARLLLALVYFLVVPFFALLYRLSRGRERARVSAWESVPRDVPPAAEEGMKREW
jgi:hypothetical protein